MALALFVIGIAGLWILAMRRVSLWQWALGLFALGALTQLSVAPPGISTSPWSWGLAALPGAVALLLAVPFVRRMVLTRWIYGAIKAGLPHVSRTEQEAIEAGTVGWDAELFSGRPRWHKLLDIRKPALTEEEQAFLDGPCEDLCAMIDDWDVRNNRADLPEAVWQFLKDKGFFGMLIGKEHGGLGFSAQAQSQVVSKVASKSIAAGITVMVPNSLGPGELLEKYGTPEQQAKYLKRLAEGKEIPCFALTGPYAGSDAASMRDVGVVCRGEYQGEQVLGVRLTWDKRYITLAPVATLLGLAFNLQDPDNLLGKGEVPGITLALIPTDFPGVETGRRHYPARSAFLNGPTRGKDVFVPIDFLIGGAERAGQGWRMLMECLSTGRAISLPAIGSVSIKKALRVTSAYARIRRQFGISIGVMEGVAAPLARLVKSAYIYEAARAVTASMVDEGQKPAVISALLKYRATEAMRESINDAMDIHGGRAIQDGPNNYLFSAYQSTPVAITVEGANILTRTLITFAQGALRAHPYLYAEIAAAQDADHRAGLKAFDKAFAGHAGFMLSNIFSSFSHAVTGGRFASSPVEHETAHWWRLLHRYAQAFALCADWVVAALGGNLKRKQLISGRMADILSDLYLLSAVLKRFEDDGRIADDLPVVEASARDLVRAIEDSFAEVFDNFPNPWLAWAMRILVLPFGRRAKASPDRENYRLARSVLGPSALRDRLTRGIEVSFDPGDPTGLLEDALVKIEKAGEVEKKFLAALKSGRLVRRLDRDAITDAIAQDIITTDEAVLLRAADEATDRVIAVDDFPPEAFAGGLPKGARADANVDAAAE